MTTVAAVNSLGGFEYNPRGNIWLNDDSTLGHKLLMKMGWSKGKGLGKNENGIKENIKVKVKSTSSGVGFKDESFFKIQSTDYDSLLKRISENCSPQNKVLKNDGKTSKQKNGGLEQRAQAFRNRLHYHKFIRGKDLSKYSEKDMKSIFMLNKTSEEERVTSEPVDSSSSLQKSSDPQEGQCTNGMDTYNSSLSMSEYFSLKMKGKKNRIPKTCGGNADTQPTLLDPGKSENENATSSAKLKETLRDAGDESTIHINQELSLSAPTACKEKRKRSKEERSYINIADRDETNEIQELSRDNSSKPSKKRKIFNVSGDMCTNSVMSSKYQLCQRSVAHSNVCFSESAPVESTCNALSGSEKESVKKQKKLKHLKMLKSCLKSKNGQYSMKNVSFSENVSYKIIDSDLDGHSDSPISSPSEVELKCIVRKTENSTVPITTEIEVADCEACPKAENIQTQMKIEASGSLSQPLHSNSSLSYNPWIESQRQAKKMKLYKKLLKNIKKHDILKSTNLLFIKGYGNWGY